MKDNPLDLRSTARRTTFVWDSGTLKISLQHPPVVHGEKLYRLPFKLIWQTPDPFGVCSSYGNGLSIRYALMRLLAWKRGFAVAATIVGRPRPWYSGLLDSIGLSGWLGSQPVWKGAHPIELSLDGSSALPCTLEVNEESSDDSRVLDAITLFDVSLPDTSMIDTIEALSEVSPLPIVVEDYRRGINSFLGRRKGVAIQAQRISLGEVIRELQNSTPKLRWNISSTGVLSIWVDDARKVENNPLDTVIVPSTARSGGTALPEALDDQYQEITGRYDFFGIDIDPFARTQDWLHFIPRGKDVTLRSILNTFAGVYDLEWRSIVAPPFAQADLDSSCWLVQEGLIEPHRDPKKLKQYPFELTMGWGGRLPARQGLPPGLVARPEAPAGQ